MTDRRTFDDPVGGEIMEAEHARSWDAACRCDDSFSQGAGVEDRSAVRKGRGSSFSINMSDVASAGAVSRASHVVSPSVLEQLDVSFRNHNFLHGICFNIC